MATKLRRNPSATRTQILDAATELFHSDGYSRSSLDAVAAKAGVTKPTVYSHFQSKKGLFEAVVAHAAEERLAKLETDVTLQGDPESDLLQFGEHVLSVALDPKTQRWDRLAAAECIAHPEVGEMFFKAGPARLLKRLADLLRGYHRDGLLHVKKPQAAAEQLIGLLFGIDLLRSQIGLKTLTPRQQKQRARQAVSLFLSAYAGDKS